MASQQLIIETHSPEETVELGRKLGERLAAGDTIALIGPLGAGKTQLTRGIAAGIGSTGRVTSPTFKLVNEYDGRVRVYHLDAYRLHGADELVALGCDEFFDGDGAAVVEWADLVAEALPDDRVRVDIAITGAASRQLTFSPTGPKAEHLIDAAMVET